MPNTPFSPKHFFAALMCSAALSGPTTVWAQEIRSILLDENPPSQADFEALELTSETDPAPLLLDQHSPAKPLQHLTAPTLPAETIRERFKNGKVQIERQVAMDSQQNYVNHGNFTEWSADGEIVSTGVYDMGQRQGPWIRFYQGKESKLFGSHPYTRFKAPLQSSAEFQSGEMNGMWVITDAENRVVSQIQLLLGVRDGRACWFHPNGQTLYQADYKDGILDGLFIEKSADGKVVRQDTYVAGQRQEAIKEHYPSKTLKSEINYLSSLQRVATADDWESATLATYTTGSEKEKHGSYQAFHENGQLMTQAAYTRGVMTGNFERWYANGEKEVAGVYDQGLQHGTWNWWHENGMRKATANYERGSTSGTVLAWSEEGKRIPSPLPEPDAQRAALRLPLNLPQQR